MTPALEHQDPTVFQPGAAKDDRTKTVVTWLVSAGLHATVLSVAALLVWTQVAPAGTDSAPTRISPIVPAPTKKPEHQVVQKPEEFTDKTVDVVQDKEVSPTVLDVPDAVVDSTDDDAPTDGRQGREEAAASSEMGSTGAFTMIGVGGPASGMYGNRTPGGKRGARSQLGLLGKPVDIGIANGLRWLKKHQNADGSWSATDYWKNCLEQPKCEPGKGQAGDTDVAMTGYALMCFLGDGYDHKIPSKFAKTVKAGIAWLLVKQDNAGVLGQRNYEHAVATQALAEAYGMTADADLRKPIERALRVISDRQSKNASYPYAWDYGKENWKRNDTSVSGWNAMALKSALGAGFPVMEQLKGVERWIDAAWKSANPAWKGLDPYKTSIFPYCWNGETDATEKDYFSAVAATCLVFLGRHQGDVQFETLLNDAEKRWIDTGRFKDNLYHLYYIALAEFEAGEGRWIRFRDAAIPHVITQQNRDDASCLNGSFGYQDQSWPGADTGRVLSTCYSLLTLECAYRYAKAKKGG